MDSQWIRFNAMTHCYETRDGTSVSVEVCDGVECLADVFHIASVRENQRADVEPPSAEVEK